MPQGISQALTFQGKRWEELDKKEKIASIGWCVEHAFDRHTVHDVFIRKWLVLHGAKIGLGSWRKILKQCREKLFQDERNNESITKS